MPLEEPAMRIHGTCLQGYNPPTCVNHMCLLKVGVRNNKLASGWMKATRTWVHT